MSSNLEKIIHKTEEKWLHPLADACSQQFAMVHLPSHDQSHHLRVWKYAKILLHHAVKQGIVISETDIERLIITVFFHDQGMSETISKEHGKIGRHICKAYFNKSTIAPPPFIENILQAIEDHDKKDYSNLNEFDILNFLNLADDLDALGTIGAYRYAEINLLRKIEIQDVPEIVLNNMSARFQHFTKMLGKDRVFIKAQNQRYLAAHNFFKDLAFQMKQVEYRTDLYLGPIGVINFIKNEIIQNKRTPLKVCDYVISQNRDFYCHHFFERLKKELTTDY
jgi:HD superfamily phosphodiesterase